jgi:hypothetical protein
VSRPGIEPALALAIAGHVSLGLTPGDGELERAREALSVIGIMLSVARPEDQLVHEALALSRHTRITALADGPGWRIETEQRP